MPPQTNFTKVEEEPLPGSLYLSPAADVGQGNNAAIRLIATPGTAPAEGKVVIRELTTAIAAFSVNRWSLDGGVPND